MNSAFVHVVLPILVMGALAMVLVAIGRGSRWLGLGVIGTACVLGSCAATILLLSVSRLSVHADEPHPDPKQATANPPNPESISDSRGALPQLSVLSVTDEVDVRRDGLELVVDSSSGRVDDSATGPAQSVLAETEPQSVRDMDTSPDNVDPTNPSTDDVEPSTAVLDIRVNEIVPSQKSGAVQIAGHDGWQVVIGPYFSRNVSPHELKEALVKAANQYIDEHIGHQGTAKILNYDMGAVAEKLCYGDLETEPVLTQIGPAQYTMAKLQFNQSFLDELNASWENARREARLKQTGFGAGGILALLATVFGFLKLDTATRRYYTSRLQLGAAVMILVLVAAGVLVARWIPWI